jgi:hypothetical protein
MHLFNDMSHVITWKRPDSKFVVDGAGFDGTIRVWEGPGDEPTSSELTQWTTQFIDEGVAAELEAESRVTPEAEAGMHAVFEAMNGSPPDDDEKAALHESMKNNLKESS